MCSHACSFTQLEEQRKYLGGDSEHTVLVKGLDFALLEQNKAKAVFDNQPNDDDLEATFQESHTILSSLPEPSKMNKKRTREELIRELKESRAKGEITEQPLNQGKFKSIGFKPIVEEKPKKKKKKVSTKEDGQRVKKKRKVEGTATPAVDSTISDQHNPPPSAPEPDPEPEIFDIFEGAGDYEGLDVSDEDEVDETKQPGLEAGEVASSIVPVPSGGWFNDPSNTAAKPPSPRPAAIPKRDPTRMLEDGEESGEEEDQPMRLVPLTSSAIPSAKELLAMDKAAEANDKRRKRKQMTKDKKEGGGDKTQLTAEAKVDRDYQRCVYT